MRFGTGQLRVTQRSLGASLTGHIPSHFEAMKPSRLSSLTAGIVLAVSLLPSAAATTDSPEHNWPQWRGPTGNGVALHGNPPTEWSEEKNIKWKVAIPGAGHATPIIWGDKIFVLTAIPTGSAVTGGNPPAPSRQPASGRGRRGGGGRGQASTVEQEFAVMCLDRKTGRVLWQRTPRREVPHEGHHQTNTYASGSPVTDGEHVYAFFSSRGLFCYDMDGKLVWQKDFGDMRTRNGFGEGVSPTLAGDKLIIVWDTEDDSWIGAFDKKTGAELWKTHRDERTGWSTPYVLDHAGRKQVIVNATNAVRCYDVATGELIWECSGQTANAIPSVVADGEFVYAMSGFRGNAAYAIELGGNGNLAESGKVKWKISRGTPYVPSPLLYDGQLYFLQGNDAMITSVDSKTGEPYYQQERLANIRSVYASPVGVAGRVYLPGREGTTLVLAKGPKLEILATNKLDDPIDASPVVIGDELFLRSHTHLYCIAE